MLTSESLGDLLNGIYGDRTEITYGDWKGMIYATQIVRYVHLCQNGPTFTQGTLCLVCGESVPEPLTLMVECSK